MSICVVVINLNRDVDRWQKISAALHPHIDKINRITALYGPDLPDIACYILAASVFGTRKKGTLGTFLSHVKAWEWVEKNSRALTVILEDDAKLIGFERLASLQVPADADLVFINDRMSPGNSASEILPIKCLPLIESLRTLNRTGFGVGGDGYILTPNGAIKLLKAVQSDFCFGHVDWRLLRYAVSQADLDGELAGSRVDKILRNDHNSARPPAWGILKAYCLNTPLVAFATSGKSVRDDADNREIVL